MKKILFALAMIVGTNSAINAQAMAHVNTQKLLDTMASRKLAEASIKDMEALYMKEIQESQAALQKEYADFQAKSATMSPTVKSYSEERIQKKSQELEQRQEELGQMLQQQSAEMNKPILERVQKAIKIVAERKKLDYVMEETQALFANPTKDITKEVTDELLKLEAIVATKVNSPVSPK